MASQADGHSDRGDKDREIADDEEGGILREELDDGEAGSESDEDSTNVGEAGSLVCKNGSVESEVIAEDHIFWGIFDVGFVIHAVKRL